MHWMYHVMTKHLKSWLIALPGVGKLQATQPLCLANKLSRLLSWLSMKIIYKRKPWTLPRLLALIRLTPPGNCRFCDGGVLHTPQGIDVLCCVCHGLGGGSA